MFEHIIILKVHLSMANIQAYFFPFLILLISTILILAFFKSKHAKSRLPPSPFSVPIIGHLHLLVPTPHQAFYKLSLKYGPVFHLFLGSVPCVVSCSPETAKEFLKTKENAYLDRPRNSATTYMTYGSKDFAFADYGSYWKFMKKIVMSRLLNGSTLDMLLPIRQDEITRYVKSLSQKAIVGKAVDLNGELVKVTNNLMSRILLSKRCSENVGDAGDIRKLIFEITETMGNFNLSDNIWLFKNLDLQGFGKRVKDIHRRFDSLIEKIIIEHEDARKDGTRSEMKDLLNILLDISEDESMEIDLTRDNLKAFILVTPKLKLFISIYFVFCICKYLLIYLVILEYICGGNR